MAGGLAVISDVPKTMVYRLAHSVNASRLRIPQASIEKPPSAELRPDQKDQDSLPPYEVLDAVLEGYIENYQTAEQIAAAHNFDLNLVRLVIRLVEKAEYKRQQAAPGLKITQKAFGVGRRFPIAAKHQV
jgi:NAD+ synthetase